MSGPAAVKQARGELVEPRVIPLVASSEGSTLAATFDEALRRALDVFASFVALVALAPLLLVLAGLVTWDSPGPVFFRQVRIGRDRRRGRSSSSTGERRNQRLFGRPFTLYKFRTMYADAPERFPELYRYQYSPDELDSIPIKVLVSTKAVSEPSAPREPARWPEDPRVTRMGRWLRRNSLDELPNLFNVLVGDLHLVGPRPDITANIRYYTLVELAILQVKPGITGLAQINGRGFLTFKQTNSYDLEYVKNRSLMLDLGIILKTFPALLRRDGAY
jgi:lipopolysaccharide/colanic/teichoic acid biosynthesis glycosyltransferase